MRRNIRSIREVPVRRHEKILFLRLPSETGRYSSVWRERSQQMTSHCALCSTHTLSTSAFLQSLLRTTVLKGFEKGLGQQIVTSKGPSPVSPERLTCGVRGKHPRITRSVRMYDDDLATSLFFCFCMKYQAMYEVWWGDGGIRVYGLGFLGLTMAV